MIKQSLQFLLFCIQKMILYQSVANASFDDILLFIDENIVTYVYFDCGITFYPETPTKFRQIYRERNYFSRSCEKLKCIPTSDKKTVSLMSSITLFQQYNWTHALKGHGSSTSFVTQPHQR